jgi:uncharacterized membrane protein
VSKPGVFIEQTLTLQNASLAVVSTFAVTYVRYQLQYHKEPWSEGIPTFIVVLGVHCIGIALLGGFGAIVVKAIADKGLKKEDFDWNLVFRYVFAAALVISVIIYVLSLWPTDLSTNEDAELGLF